jgi:hypothetical protein
VSARFLAAQVSDLNTHGLAIVALLFWFMRERSGPAPGGFRHETPPPPPGGDRHGRCARLAAMGFAARRVQTCCRTTPLHPRASGLRIGWAAARPASSTMCSGLLRPQRRGDISAKAVVSPKLVSENANNRLASGRSCRCFFQACRVICSRRRQHQGTHRLDAHHQDGERPPGCEDKPVDFCSRGLGGGGLGSAPCEEGPASRCSSSRTSPQSPFHTSCAPGWLAGTVNHRRRRQQARRPMGHEPTLHRGNTPTFAGPPPALSGHAVGT